jgi:hypothetical protein
MSISLKTVLNPGSHTNEIALASAIMHAGVNIEGATAQMKPSGHFTAVCVPSPAAMGGRGLPMDFAAVARSNKGRHHIACVVELMKAAILLAIDPIVLQL